MLLEQAHQWLGWPSPERILDPQGSGARASWEFAKRKINDSLKQKFPLLQVETGILVYNSDSSDTTAPLAVVCQFASGANDEALNEAHRLAWSFSRTSLLVTLEPHRIIAWTCYCDPNQPEHLRRVCELPTPPGFKPSGTPEQRSIRDLLHWVSLITGHIQRQRPGHFPIDGRADALLLKNLQYVRGELMAKGLPVNFCHDLLARIIFTQYLFHRRDGEGNAFFSPSLLDRLKKDGTLKPSHDDLGSILQDHGATYALFRWLDERFNGDLFPGKADSSAADRDAAWQTESNAVRPDHLLLLANLVSGTIDTTDRQLRLWPQYSFDTIPLEFISSVYEEFLNEEKYKTKAFYTPSHLVDYVLDAVLPWDGDEWDLQILDPSCGSGIFLVKAFQRLIYRWRRANGREPLVRDLKPILAKNLTGVDINPEAVRVACFSLYLAMADAIEPKHYVTREKVFPPLRGKRLIANDFFDETISGFQTHDDKGTFDLVIGNSPWGDKSIKKTSDIAAACSPNPRKKKVEPPTNAEAWAKAHDWPVANNDIGPLFLAKGLELVRDDGKVAMVQPAGPWLYHRAEPAMQLRKRLFETCTVDELTNLSAIRRELFTDAIGPACIIVVGKEQPSAETTLLYFTPKPLKTKGPIKDFTIEPQDVSRVSHHEAASDPLVWPVLSLGGRRDLNLIRKLNSYETLEKLKAKNEVMTREGVVPGNQTKDLPELRNKPYLDDTKFADDVFLELNASVIPAWKDPKVHSKDSTDFNAFKNPQLLIKQGYSVESGRFRAALVSSNDPIWGVICNQTYLSVRDLSPDSRHILAACLAYNSLFAVYFLALTGSRLGHYRTEMPTKELMTVPLPKSPVDLAGVSSFDEIDELTRKLFALTKADWTVIEDLLEFTLPDALGMAPGPGREKTQRGDSHDRSEPELSVYAQTMFRVLKSTFGSDKAVAATIYQEPHGRPLPVRMVTLHFDWRGRKPLTVEPIEADGLLDELAKFHRDTSQRRTRTADGTGLGFQRVAYFFHSHRAEQGRIRNLTIIKPDERRYWTRSLAMRDADDLAAAIFKAAGWKGESP